MPIGGEMSIALTVVIAWLVVLPLAFLLLVALYPRYLRWYVARPRRQLVSRVDLTASPLPRETHPRVTWR
jgi:hypothetical protein